MSSVLQLRIPEWPQQSEVEERYLLEVLRSGRWFAGMTGSDPGTQTALFEAEFAREQGVRFAVAVTNGTAAIEIALRAAGVGPGDEVIVPAYTFIATASAVAQLGAVPVIVDVQESDLNLDPDRVAEALGPKTKAILPVHVGGQIADMKRLVPLAREHGIVIVEDGAHAQGSVRYGTPAGQFGAAGTFSFQHSKTMSGGEGGMIVTEDEQVYQRLRSLRSSGRTDPADPYLHGLLGWNYRMTEWQAAVLRAQLSRAGEQRRQREWAAARLREFLADLQFITPVEPAPETTRHNQYYFSVILAAPATAGGRSKHRVIEALRESGVPASGGYPRPIGDNPMFQHVPARLFPVPVAESLCDRIIHLPHQVLLADDETLLGIRAAFDHAVAQAGR